MARPDAVAIERHPHLANECPAGFVRVDMHTHTMFSGDSTTTFDEVAESVVEAGIDVLCITDHNAVDGARRLIDALKDVCRVIIGEEVRTHTGEIIGLFLNEKISYGAPAGATAMQIRQQGGIVYVPHPFDPMRKNLTEASLIEIVDAGLVDAIEAFNAKTSLQSLNARATQFGHDKNLVLGAGSDAHVPHALGAAYMEMPDFDGPRDFLEKLREGTVVGHHWDKARPWSPRIVPSIVDN